MEQNSGIPAEPFTYDLPFDRIAQRPVHPPESAKLLAAQGGDLRAALFSDLPEILRAGDMLVFNHTRVFPARFRGSIGGSRADAELLLIKQSAPSQWRCLAKPLKKLQPGTEIVCAAGLIATVVERVGEKEIVIHFSSRNGDRQLVELMQEAGEMPIPPYIRKGRADDDDRHDYQSIFAENLGSIAAPTASLHFSQALVDALEARGVRRAALTLHLGTASFLPLFTPDQPQRLTPPGAERYFHSRALLEEIAALRAAGGRVFAVGTSVVRALESMVRNEAEEGSEHESALFITPGFEFRALDGIITNFHQPGTTHLLLVEAFLGRENLARAYRHALDHDFRFLSYGDGMILLPKSG